MGTKFIKEEIVMRKLINISCIFIAVLAVGKVAIALSMNGEVFVATKQVQLQTKTFLLKLPVEAQRGERWEVIKRNKNKVTLTFGPKDSRRDMLKSAGMNKLPEYEVNSSIFDAGFVHENQWTETRKALAAELKRRFESLSIEECEKLIEGELWIGMKKEHAEEAVGNRVLKKEIRETQEGKSENWRVGAFSITTTAKSTAKAYVFEDTLTSSPSRPMEPLDVRANRDLEANTRFILGFKNDILAEIIRR
jgi:hypothetical protein